MVKFKGYYVGLLIWMVYMIYYNYTIVIMIRKGNMSLHVNCLFISSL